MCTIRWKRKFTARNLTPATKVEGVDPVRNATHACLYKKISAGQFLLDAIKFMTGSVCMHICAILNMFHIRYINSHTNRGSQRDNVQQ